MEQINEAAAVQQPQQGGKRLKKGTNRIFWLVPAGLLALLAAAYIGVCAYAHSQTVFYPNYGINGMAVAGMTAEEAQALLDRDFPAQTVAVKNADGGETLAELTLADLGITAESVSGWAAEAMWHQQSKPFLMKGWLYLGAFTDLQRQGAVFHCDAPADLPETVAAEVKADLYIEPIHAAYELRENDIAVTVPADGRALDAAALAEELRFAAHVSHGPRDVFVTFETLPADRLTAKDIYNAVAGEMKNAGYDKATDSVIPEEVGVQFHVDSAQKAMDSAEPGSVLSIPAEITRPEVTAAHLKEVLFRDVLGEYTTKVSGSVGRRGNVKLSAAAIHNYVMNAGDIFSYNEAVGQRTAANGYQPAPAYVRGETVDEIGGGICQTSSTLYYACLLANLEITERYAHRYAPGYITLGIDATVSWGGPDYKFTNDTLYPVRIETVYENNKLTVRLLGTKTDGTYAKMTSEYLGKTDWTTVYQEDETVAPGTQVVKTEPYTGHKVRTFHTIYNADGTVLDSHYEATSDYKVRNKVILVAPGYLPAPDGSVPTGGTVPLPVTPADPGTPVIPAVPEETTPPTVIPMEPEEGGAIIVVPEAPPEEDAETPPIIFAE